MRCQGIYESYKSASSFLFVLIMLCTKFISLLWAKVNLKDMINACIAKVIEFFLERFVYQHITRKIEGNKKWSVSLEQS